MFYYSRFLSGVKKKTWQTIKFLNHLEICYFLKKNQKEDVMNAIVETLYKDHQVKPLMTTFQKKN